ncbi:PadR family transcriptional regulator [Rhizobium sp. SAFR-030]|uniref:PadR family transcriptional regulator n=1 Tax=Rhizobium sp. SAFR-030 TaxID=3387277 RepID=UPI003F7E5D6A
MFGNEHDARHDGQHGGHEHGRDHGHRDWAGLFAARGGFGRGFGRSGQGGPGGPGGHGGHGGDDGEGRIGRFLLQGDLRLLVLALIEKEPRHGYEIIRYIEDLTYGFYAPSPGVVYPTLTYLEEAGYVTAEMDGTKKRYSITEEGRAHLEDNRSMAATILDRLSQLAERIRQKQERRGRGREDAPHLPRSLEAAMLNLHEVVARRIQADERQAGELVKQLLQFAEELERGGNSPA